MYLGKDKNDLWEVRFYYKDYSGKRKQKHKTGFGTKRAATEWANNFLIQQRCGLDITFVQF